MLEYMGDHLVKKFVRSLKVNAFDWYTDLEAGSIDRWEHLEQEFLYRFYSTRQTVSMVELTNSRQWKENQSSTTAIVGKVLGDSKPFTKFESHFADAKYYIQDAKKEEEDLPSEEPKSCGSLHPHSRHRARERRAKQRKIAKNSLYAVLQSSRIVKGVQDQTSKSKGLGCALDGGHETNLYGLVWNVPSIEPRDRPSSVL
ncbi:hypothetical protein Sango_2946600 [Sesamum angolense]|uniref:Retrotransposon gag domain-containing protein n=1 Tax=Sesamum angolense TaxID=2727404 RepID=A0AAE1VZW9_9LAMI|nr:hypothetical protein Sango_2946600 [Sesamum angolense]